MKSELNGKTILLGVSGGIAAYKTPELVRLLKKAGASVQVFMTEPAKQFVTPVTLGTVSENPVLSDVFPENREGSWTVHIHQARRAALFILAPATANTLAKLAHGHADNMLTTTYLALPQEVPVLIVPAMDTDMFVHPATQTNLEILRQRGHVILPPDDGPLASGLSGPGRMPEPAKIAETAARILKPEPKILAGKRVLISAGPTREAIDPVRFISNYSSGKMGFALAETAARLGAEVTLVSGPVHLPDPAGLRVLRVESAVEMQKALEAEFSRTDLLIMAAAVADYRVETVAGGKIKKEDSGNLELKLIKNPDILAGLGKQKKHQTVVGFALETDQIVENATRKLKEKNLDAIVLNRANEPGAGFETDTNIVKILFPDGTVTEFSKMLKKDLAGQILSVCCRVMEHHHV